MCFVIGCDYAWVDGVQVLDFYLLDFQFLCRVADVLSDYLEGLNEDVIKDNFVIVYEVLL